MTDARPRLLVWDAGALTQENTAPLAGFSEAVAITNGPRQAQLQRALQENLPECVVQCLPQAVDSMEDAVGLSRSLDPRASVLVAGAPFDAEGWVKELAEVLRRNQLPGFVVLIPGAPGTPLTSVALTPEAVQYALLLRGGLADALGVTVTATGGVPTGESAAVDAIRSQSGPVALIWATKEYHAPVMTPPPTPVRASDIVHAIMKDTGLEITNRTDMSAELNVLLGAPDGKVLETLQLTLSPGEHRGYSGEELGSVGLLEPPTPELRQWSHEAEVVYVGGKRRIHGISIRYLSGTSILGEDTFGNPNSLGAATTSTEIARVTGRSARSVGRRLSDLAAREDWGAVLRCLTTN